MSKDLVSYIEALKARGLTPEQEARLVAELETAGAEHAPPATEPGTGPFAGFFRSVYAAADLLDLQKGTTAERPVTQLQKSLDELLERDRRREEDGFPRKIRVGKLVKPGRGTAGKVVVVPTTEEEKFIHDPTVRPQDEGGTGGTGDEGEGEIIGEQPVRPEGEAGAGAGTGGEESHELESTAYDLGKILTERFELPNLKDKGKKSALVRYSYDLTDKHRGFGQLLDKKATLRKILETNIALGNIPDLDAIDTTRLLISPADKVYRILSRELDYESKAMVFFVRDYSGSMDGKPTELIASQHVLIYSWLLYQFAMQVESRFILHDNEAKEAPDFYTYYNSKVAGGTKVASAYRLVNEIVEKEDLAKDYNIYVFHGTDGDDWDTEGKEAVPELRIMLGYANRVGVTVVRHAYNAMTKSEVENYLEGSALLDDKPELLRLDVMGVDAEEGRLIEGIKRLIS